MSKSAKIEIRTTGRELRSVSQVKLDGALITHHFVSKVSMDLDGVVVTFADGSTLQATLVGSSFADPLVLKSKGQ